MKIVGKVAAVLVSGVCATTAVSGTAWADPFCPYPEGPWCDGFFAGPAFRSSDQPFGDPSNPANPYSPLNPANR